MALPPSSSPDPLATKLSAALLQHFGHKAFRPGQEIAARAVMEGRDVVAVMPTGAGKSICYQLPALLLDGVTLVISPLIALMKDQVDALVARGISAAAIHSGMSGGERSKAERNLAAGQLRLAYVAPERLGTPRFMDLLTRTRVARLIVDEAHCISQWGHDFRPDYRRIGGLRQELGVSAAAFTATATPEVRGDISRQLHMEDPLELVTGFERPNLTLSVEECPSRVAKAQALDRVLRHVGTPGIVYSSTRKGVELWAALLKERGLKAACYHAGLADEERHRVQDAFLAGELEAIAATNAFGMGVDKANIRFVVHADLPGSVEAYYQEAGRAGRDGLPARCLLLYSPVDVRTQEFFLQGSNPSPESFRHSWELLGQGFSDEQIEAAQGGGAAHRMAAATAARLLRQTAEVEGLEHGEGPPPVDLERQAEKARRDAERLQAIIAYANARGCRTRFIYRFFAGDTAAEMAACGSCDICLGWRFSEGREPTRDELLKIRIALSGVARLDGRFGVARIAQVLVGSRSKEILQWGLHRLPTYGKLSSFRQDDVKALLALLLEGGLVRRQPVLGARPGTFVLATTEEGRAVMKGEAMPRLPLPELAGGNARPEEAPALRPPGGNALRGALLTSGAKAPDPHPLDPHPLDPSERS